MTRLQDRIHRIAALGCLLLWCVAVHAERYTIPLWAPANTAGAPQGVLRVVNDTLESGTVEIHAIDDAGARAGSATFTLNASEAVEFDAAELASGNAAKGLSGGVGGLAGETRLVIETELAIVALAFVRSADGTLSAMHDTVPGRAVDGTGHVYDVPVFNPASEVTQASRLRLINPGDTAVEVTIEGRDGGGTAAAGGSVRLTLPAGGARTLTAWQLEAGDPGLTGQLGAGAGKWRLTVTAQRPIRTVNIVASASGYWSNLSTSAAPDEEPVDGIETRYGAGDELASLPGGAWIPDTASGAQMTVGPDGLTIRLDDGGYIGEAGYRYTCRSAGGCEIGSRAVVSGTVVRTAIDTVPADTQPAFPGDGGPGGQGFTAGTAIEALILPAASGGDGALSYSLTPAIPGLTFNAATRQLAGTPATVGTYAMTYTVMDGDGDTDTLAFTVTLEDADGGGDGGTAEPFDLHPGNGAPTAIVWANGRFYVPDWLDGVVYAYGADGQYEAGADFDLHPDNSRPDGIAWANGRFHVVDWRDDKVYAYNADGSHEAAADFDLLDDNGTAEGIAYANGRLFVVDADEDKVYSYAASPGTDDGAGTAYEAGDILANLPAGTWIPDAASGARVAFGGDGVTITLDDGGYVEEAGYRYTCRSVGGCEIGNREVVSGRIVRTAIDIAPPPDTRPGFPAGGGPGGQSYTAGTAIEPLTLPAASGGDGTLTYSLSPEVPGLTFNAAARLLTGTPTAAGSHSMTYTATDADGDTDALSFTIAVEDAVETVSKGFDLTYPYANKPVDLVYANNRFYVLSSVSGSDAAFVAADHAIYAYSATGERDEAADIVLDDLARGDIILKSFAYANDRFYVLMDYYVNRVWGNKVAVYSATGERERTADFDLANIRYASDIVAAEGRLFVFAASQSAGQWAYAHSVTGQRLRDFDIRIEPFDVTPGSLVSPSVDIIGITYANRRFYLLEGGGQRSRGFAHDYNVYAYTLSGKREEIIPVPTCSHPTNWIKCVGLVNVDGQFYITGGNRYKYDQGVTAWLFPISATFPIYKNSDGNTYSPWVEAKNIAYANLKAFSSGGSSGITYANGRLYVLDVEPQSGESVAYAYSAATGEREESADFDLGGLVWDTDTDTYTYTSANPPEGFTYFNGRFYVPDGASGTVYAYSATGEREETADFDLVDSAFPKGIAHANDRLYVVDSFFGKVYAYSATGEREAAADFDLDADNGDPYGIAYVNGQLLVTDWVDDWVYVYVAPAG